MATKTKQMYTPNADLQRAKAQMLELNRRRDERSTSLYKARQRVSAAGDSLSLLELKAGFEAISPAVLAAARKEFADAKDLLAVAEDGANAPTESFAYLSQKIAELEDKEQRDNMAALRPIYAEKLRHLDAALDEAAKVSAELNDLIAANRPLYLSLPDGWTAELLTPAIGESKLMRWRRELAAAGWPTR